MALGEVLARSKAVVVMPRAFNRLESRLPTPQTSSTGTNASNRELTAAQLNSPALVF